MVSAFKTNSWEVLIFLISKAEALLDWSANNAGLYVHQDQFGKKQLQLA